MAHYEEELSGKNVMDMTSAADHLARQAFALVTDAASYLTEAGKNMMAIGRLNKAVSLLDLARMLLAIVDDLDLRATTLEALLGAQLAVGRAAVARDLSAEVDELECSGLRPYLLASLRIQLAWADVLACDPVKGLARVRDIRALLSENRGSRLSLAVDAVECWLLAQTFQSTAASELAWSVISAAGQYSASLAACRAWEVLGIVARRADPAESTACFWRARSLAQEHGVPSHRLRVQLELGLNEWTSTGDTDRIALTQREAERRHVLPVACQAGILIAIDLTLRGRYAQAGSLVERYLTQARDAGLTSALRWALLARCALAAHQHRRRDMEAALSEIASQSDDSPYLMPLTLLLAATVCALLDADRSQAASELHRAVHLDSQRPGPCRLAGWESLDVLIGGGHDDTTPADDFGDRSLPAGLPFWSKPFVVFGRGALLGKQGRGSEAMAAVTLAEQLATPYPLMHHLGLLMIAEIAHADGWGSPVAWLRQAEAFFHELSIPAASHACRSLLQRIGVPLPQHRLDTNRIPASLRALGVTVREYEVLKAIGGGQTNHGIARLLFISSRTVEKHIASLRAKTGLASRQALADLVTNS